MAIHPGDETSHVTAVLDHDEDRSVLSAAHAMAGLLGVGTESLQVGPDGHATRVDLVVAALGDDDVSAAVLSAKSPDALCWDVMARVSKPLLVLPRRGERILHAISRVLLPLDGTPETAAGVAGAVRLMIAAGAEVKAVHVFDAATVPAFWDQAAHSHASWTEEFLRRNLPEPVQLDLRSGRTPEEVGAEADRTDVDLIVMGWSRDLSAGKARTVRRALTEGQVPVLLVSTKRASPAGS